MYSPFDLMVRIAGHSSLASGAQILFLVVRSCSLDAPIADEEQYHLVDTLEDTSMVVPSEHVSYQVLRNNLEQAMNILNAREGTIIEMRYGLLQQVSYQIIEVFGSIAYLPLPPLLPLPLPLPPLLPLLPLLPLPPFPSEPPEGVGELAGVDDGAGVGVGVGVAPPSGGVLTGVGVVFSGGGVLSDGIDGVGGVASG